MTKDLKDIGPSAFRIEPESGRPKRTEGGRKIKSLCMGLLFMVCVGLAIYWISRSVPLISKALSGSPYFRLDGVDVIGAVNADRGEIGDAVGFKAGSPILETDLAAVRNRVRSVDWVKDVHVQRKLPNRLVVTIVEHTPVGVVATDDGYRFVDPDGEIAEIDAGAGGYPIFSGMKTKGELTDGARLVLTLYEKGIILTGSVRSVEYDEAMGYTVSTGGGVHLRFGQPPFDKKIERLIAVLPDIQRRGPVQYIYLDIEGRIIVKNKTPVM